MIQCTCKYIDKNMKIAIIGAGPAGLSAIRNCLDESIKCVAFEQTGKIGGIWNYVEDQDVDENDLPVHSSMYKGLITNLPKELMEFNNFRYPENEQSYISQEKVLDYVHRYAEHFNLLPHVTFYHQVLLVDPLPDEKWAVKVKNLKTKEISLDTYDGVLVCNGHYFDPFYPVIPGMDNFTGKGIHSHNYRKPDKYKGKRVLIVGAGPSGVDICRLVTKVAKKVYLSFNEDSIFGQVPENAIPKPRVVNFKDNFAVFADETREEIDDIIYCTGYNNSFPFLSEKCQIRVDENWVKPIYKHLINIEHPSMAIINLITSICPFPIFGLQIRFYLALLKEHFHVSKEDMYEDLRKDRESRDQKGLPKKMAHILGRLQLAYCEDLAQTANIKGIPRVIGNMFIYFIENKMPRDNFKILNDEEFAVLPITDGRV